MLVSGGKLIAIDNVQHGDTLKGDGVFNPLQVDTNKIAEVSSVNKVSSDLTETIRSTSSTLNDKIDSVSSVVSGKQDKLTFQYAHDEITAINSSAIAGGNKVDLKSSDNSVNISKSTSPDTGVTTYDLTVSAEPVISPVIVEGNNGLSAGTGTSAGKTVFTVGIDTTTKTNIDKIPTITAAITALSSNKADKNSVYQKNETSSKDELTTEFAKYQQKGDYYSATNPSGFINKYSADGLYQPKGNYLSSNALNNLSSNWEKTYTAVTNNSGNWNSVYTTVSTNSGNWNEISSVSGIRNELKTFSAVVINKKDDPTIDYVVPAQTSASVFKLVEKPNNYVTLDTNNNQILIGVTGLQPAGDYVTNTEFVEYKNSAKSALDLKQDIAGMTAYATSSWVTLNFLPIDAINSITGLSGKWDAASDEVTSHSANWNSVYNTVTATSSNWNDVSAKLDKDDFEAWSAQTEDWDVTHYSGEEPIVVDNHKIKLTAEYLTADALDELSGKWQDASEYIIENSADFRSVYETVETFSGDWNEVSSNSAKIDSLSSELKIASGYIEEQIEDLSGYIENINDDIDTISAEVDKKLDIDDYHELTAGDNIDITNYVISSKNWLPEIEEASANAVTTVEGKFGLNDGGEITSYNSTAFANDKYQAGYGLDLDDNTFSVSAGMFALSADVYNKDEVDEKIAKFGGYTTANADASGYPSVVDPSNKLIYLVKMGELPTSSDNYKEWIYSIDTSVEPATGKWECVGETTLDLSPYLKIADAAETYQLKGDYVTSSTEVISANKNYALTNDGTNVKWVELEDNDTTYTAGKNIVISGNNNEISVSGLFNTTLTSEDYSVGITATTDASGNIQYNLGVNTVPDISGVSGISAYYDSETDKYIVCLDDYNDIGFAKFRSNANTFTTSATVTGYVQELNVNPTKITLEDDQILLKTGFYHIDVQLDFNITTVENYYYDVLIKSIPGAASITQMIDASYEHKETVDLSFDIRIAEDDTPIGINVENFKENETFAITNLNIHEIVSMPSQIQGGAGEYQAGEAIDLTNNTVSVKYNTASGIAVDSTTNQLYIKLGEGLKFDTEGAAEGSLSLSNIAQDVIDTVETISNDLDEKVTSNFPPAMISKTDCDIAAYRNAGSLYGNLFNVSINSVIEVDRTQLGFYIYQVDHDKNVIFGLYEYQPDYPRYNNEDPVQGISGYGRTVPLCDTGVITIPAGTTGFCEYPIKNLNNTIGGDNPETRPALKSSCMYYATIFLGSDMSEGGLCLAGVPNGYAPQFNQIKPGLNVYQDNFNLTLNDAAYSAKISFNDFGFGWKYTNYPNHYTQQDTTSAALSYQEKADGHRFYMQIRNKPKTRN